MATRETPFGTVVPSCWGDLSGRLSATRSESDERRSQQTPPSWLDVATYCGGGRKKQQRAEHDHRQSYRVPARLTYDRNGGSLAARRLLRADARERVGATTSRSSDRGCGEQKVADETVDGASGPPRR